MCKQQMRLAYSAVYHKKLKIIKLEWLNYVNLFLLAAYYILLPNALFFLYAINTHMQVC